MPIRVPFYTLYHSAADRPYVCALCTLQLRDLTGTPSYRPADQTVSVAECRAAGAGCTGQPGHHSAGAGHPAHILRSGSAPGLSVRREMLIGRRVIPPVEWFELCPNAP